MVADTCVSFTLGDRLADKEHQQEEQWADDENRREHAIDPGPPARTPARGSGNGSLTKRQDVHHHPPFACMIPDGSTQIVCLTQ